jgi:antitoxin CcdA
MQSSSVSTASRRATNKKPTNVSINRDLLEQAKALQINLSATLEEALTEAVRQKQQALWKQENREAINAYNQMVEENGTFSDDLRGF